MDEKFFFGIAISLSVLLVLLGCVFVGSVSTATTGEDWSDGPGVITERIGGLDYSEEINGVPLKLYIQMWNYDIDTANNKKGSTKYKISREELNNSEISAVELLNIAYETDFSFYTHPGSIVNWNKIAFSEYKNNYEGDEVSWVPQFLNNLEKSEKGFIRSAYVEPYSIDPSVRIDTARKNDVRYIRNSGKIRVITDYRVEPPGDSESMCSEKKYSRKNVEIKYVKLTTDENLLGERENADRGVVFKYNNLSAGKHTLYLKSKIKGNWSYTGWEGEYYSNNESETPSDLSREECYNVHRVSGTVKDELTLETSFEVRVREKLSGNIKYATFPNGRMQIYIKTNGRWTEAVLPNGGSVSSGWRLYISRDRNYNQINRYDTDGIPASENDFSHPSNPPVQITAFPSSYGVIGLSGKKSDKQAAPEIIMSNGTTINTSSWKPTELKLSYAGTFTDPRVVVAEIPGTYSTETTVRGVLGTNSFSGSPEPINVKKPKISYKFIDYNNETNNGTLRIKVTNKETGAPIKLENTSRSIRVKNETIRSTGGDGIVKYTGKFPGVLSDYRIVFESENWWEVPKGKTAYADRIVRFNPPGGVDAWDIINRYLALFFLFGGLYFVLRKSVLRLTKGKVDLKRPVTKFVKKVKDILSF